MNYKSLSYGELRNLLLTQDYKGSEVKEAVLEELLLRALNKMWEPIECYFCNSKDTILFHEHYIFCSECSAIYTTYIVHNAGCGHIQKGIPTVLRLPWYEKARLAKVWLDDEYCCSICGSQSFVDGW